jgi:hypothetical protein
MHVALESICGGEQRLECGHHTVDRISEERSATLGQESNLTARPIAICESSCGHLIASTNATPATERLFQPNQASCGGDHSHRTLR